MKTVRMMLVCLCTFMLVTDNGFGGNFCYAQNAVANDKNKSILYGKHDKIVIATYKNIPPYLSVNDQGEFVGFSADIVKCIMDNLGLDYEWKWIDYGNLIDLFADGNVDMMPSMIVNDTYTMDKRVHYTIPYYQISMSIVSRKGTSYSSLEELNGKSIIVNNRGASYDYLQGNGITDKITIVSDFSEGMELMSDTKYDAFLGDDLSLESTIRHGRYKNLTLNRIRQIHYDGAIVIGANNEPLLYAVNKELAQIKIDGKYDKIYRKWLTEQDHMLSMSILKYGLLFAVIMFLLVLGSLYMSRRKERVTKQLLDVSDERRKKVDKYNSIILSNINAGLVYLTPDYLVLWENMSHFSNDDMARKYIPGELCYKSHGHDAPCNNCPAFTAFETQKPDSIEFSQPEYSVEITAIPILNDSNKVEGVILRADDTTERKKMFDELETAKDKAERSDRLKSAFLANMSHEIRTPLNAIVGFSELIKDTDDEQEKNEFYKIISQNSEMLLKLINDILDLSKIEAGYIEVKNAEFSMTPLFDELHMTLSSKIPAGVEFLCDIPDKDYEVVFDKNRLKQIISNFVNNSAKFTFSGHIKMGYVPIDGGIRIFVEDTGIGISEENRSKIFGRFEKLDNFAPGTGLGLAICKSIVESRGGEIGVDSKLNEGSCFWAVIPCKCSIAGTNGVGQPNDDSKQRAANSRLSGKTILVAEDNDSNFVLVELLLKGNNVIRAINGSEAVEKAMSAKPDMILMDIRMPVMNGFEATRNIRNFNAQVPVVALTANAFGQDIEAAIEAGCNSYITKPINSHVLISTLEKYCH